MGPRYYAAWLGRWVSCDPGDLIDSKNLYKYTRSTPVVYSDSSGYQTKPKEGFWSGVREGALRARAIEYGGDDWYWKNNFSGWFRVLLKL